MCAEDRGLCQVCSEHSGCMARINNLEKAVENGSFASIPILLNRIIDKLDGTEQAQPAKNDFWNTKSGQLIFICITIIACVGILCLAGQQALQVLDYIPKVGS